MLLAAILLLGILTMWVPARWPLSAFQVAIFAVAAARLVVRSRNSRPIPIHPLALTLAAAAGWGVVQYVAGWTVDPARTAEEILNWITNAAAFVLALELAGQPRRREFFLNAVLIFSGGLAVVAMLTLFSSPPGVIFWGLFPGSDLGTNVPTLGPFVYRNQYAAFVEAILPLALVRALFDRERGILYVALCAVLFASVVAGGSRTGSILCLAEILIVPVLAWLRGLAALKIIAQVTLATVAAVAAMTAVVGWESLYMRLQEPNAYSLRADLLRSSAAMIAERPLTGFGLGTWSSVYPGYALFDDGSFVNQAHNDWAQWACEGGMPFLALLLFVAASAVRPALRSIWGVGILVVFIHCLVDYPMQQRPALAAFFFSMLGLVVAAGDASRSGRVEK
jgi:hypothetical protein